MSTGLLQYVKHGPGELLGCVGRACSLLQLASRLLDALGHLRRIDTAQLVHLVLEVVHVGVVDALLEADGSIFDIDMLFNQIFNVIIAFQVTNRIVKQINTVKNTHLQLWPY